ncbi:deleted in malignant brain tumors 1 protein-like [Xyrauchen texanus]|uniref:deleted in malignant brain tumors 1 protein-like n=1 Tax=Xyrauchen texanus TaxID=154827 RepID=UPI0022419920|nr:deleted in malignant brain tumors 1 protein-like [Xyrauchen texanus]
MLHFIWLTLCLIISNTPSSRPTSSVRLVDGINSCSGRVEVNLNGVWGRVCDEGWNWNDAAVVCRELGCGTAKEAKRGGYFGEITGGVLMNYVQCSGSESSLTSCDSWKWKSYMSNTPPNSCLWGKDAGVICWRNLRLADGVDSCSGRVEIYHQWWWGTVCDNGWNLANAAVVCREMGCGEVIQKKSGPYFGSGQIWLDNVQCVGNEITLSNCLTINNWGVYTCDHSKDAGVICQSSVRLVNGVDSCSGRVEVFYKEQWGTVCDDSWDWWGASLVCKELGCGSVIEEKRGAYYSKGTGPVWLSGVQCDNYATSLRNCNSKGWKVDSCGHEKDAGVACQRKVRLVNGIKACSGRVEVYKNGEWGTVCDNDWDATDAAVVCREMGCGEVIEAKTGAYFGQGSGQIWMDRVACVGYESTLSACESHKWGLYDCDHSKEAGVICQSHVRLVNGSDFCSGRVEVFYLGTWGTVCDDGWDWNEAAVVCRELGCGDVIETKSGAFFGQGIGQVWLSDLQCGTESSVRNCKSSGWGKNSCTHEKDAGVICQYPIRLVSGRNTCSGRVEVHHDGQWGTVYDDGWDLSEAAVLCRELGCGNNPKEVYSGAYFGQVVGPVWMNGINCTGSESALMDCTSNGWGSRYYWHDQDVVVSCTHSTVLLRINVTVAPGVDPNDPGIMSTLLEKMGSGLQSNGTFSLRWRIQPNGNVFQKKGIFP